MTDNVGLRCPVCSREETWPRAQMGTLPQEVSRIESPCDQCDGEGERYFDGAGHELFLEWSFGNVEVVPIHSPHKEQS
jgi:hypothetical protein